MRLSKKQSPSRRTFLRNTAMAVGTAGTITANAKRAHAEEGANGQWTILVTIDTLRADHCGCYGYPRPTTPFLDELAARGARFSRCTAASTSTYPSHSSLFTGLELPQHGVMANRSPVMAEGANTMASILAERGYATGATVSAPFLRKMREGFHHFDFDRPMKDTPYRWSEHTVQEARSFLKDKRRTDDVFLWVHVFDPHEWMNSSEPQAHLPEMEVVQDEALGRLYRHWTVGQGKFVKTHDTCISGMRSGNKEYFISKQLQYDSRIRYTDNCLRNLFSYVEANGPKDNTLWIVTADHGEALGNHRYDQHSRYLYEDLLRVPLILYASGNQFTARTVEVPVTHIDVWPTLAEMLGWSVDGMRPQRHGRSLLPLLKGATARNTQRRIFAHRQIKHPEYKSAEYWTDDFVYSVCSQNHKYTVRDAAEDEFYDLNEDPLELTNLVEKPSVLKDTLRDAAHAILKELRADSLTTPQGMSPGLDAQEEEALRALGYI